MIIKEITKQDYDTALKIYNECFNRNINAIKLPILGNLIGLYKDDNLIGIIQIDYLNNIMENKQQAIINNFCIKKEYQNKGYGTYFLNEIITYLKEKNINHITLTSNKNRVFAHKIYKKNDFSIIDTIILNKDL